MPEMLRWPYRIVLYFTAYVLWLIVALSIGIVYPDLPSLEALNLLPVGWIPVALVFVADIYFNQLKRRKSSIHSTSSA